MIEQESIPMKDFFNESKNIYSLFDMYSNKKASGYEAPNFPVFNEYLEGLESGLYLFAAESNSGKSALMLNLILDYCRNHDNNLFGMYYSLDDSSYELIPRIIAMDELIPISAASKPKRYQEKIDNGEENSFLYVEWLTKREEGLRKLKDQSDKFMIIDNEIEFDGIKIDSIEKMYDHLKKVQIFIKSVNPDANLIIAIDSLSDLRFSNKTHKSSKELYDEVSRTIKKWSKELDIPIFGSVHLRKLNANRRPTLDDLKESTEWVYESSVTFLIHNDVSKNKQNANISYETSIDKKMPIIEIDWAKNKKSSFKGRSFCYFTPNFSKVTECPKEIMDRYNQLIYAL